LVGVDFGGGVPALEVLNDLLEVHGEDPSDVRTDELLDALDAAEGHSGGGVGVDANLSGGEDAGDRPLPPEEEQAAPRLRKRRKTDR